MNRPDQQRPKPGLVRPIFAGVLIGGASTRMGRSKAFLELGGVTFVQRVITAVRDHVERIVFLGDGSVPPVDPDIERLSDAPDVPGPLGGILAALRWRRDTCWLIAACDLPMLQPAAMRWLLEQRRRERWAILPRTASGHVEPLSAVYEPRSLELLETRNVLGAFVANLRGIQVQSLEIWQIDNRCDVFVADSI